MLISTSNLALMMALLSRYQVASFNDLRALLYINNHPVGPNTPSKIARHLGISHSAGTFLADRLVDKGLAAEDPGRDRRLRPLKLTDQGREFINTLTGHTAEEREFTPTFRGA